MRRSGAAPGKERRRRRREGSGREAETIMSMAMFLTSKTTDFVTAQAWVMAGRLAVNGGEA